MKKLILMLALASFSMLTYAQGTTKELLGDPNKTTDTKVETSKKESGKKAEVKKVPYYNCPQCFYSDTKPGQCPTHKYDLVKEGMWHCPMNYDGGVGEAEGRCPKCNMAMIKMEYREHKEAKKEETNKK